MLSRADPIDPARLAAAVSALGHRGPDGDGSWIAGDRMTGLGHSRLAVVGVRGRQPIASEDAGAHIVVNGELYGFERIRRELEGRGHRFRTDTDSEIALHLYEDHGLDFLSELRGEFALVLWDARRRRLVAARDRFGIKPLCYADSPAGVLIASEVKALLAAGVPARWDAQSFLHAATHQYLPPARTLFDRVSQLPPGSVLLADEHGTRIERYWDLDLPRTRWRPAGDAAVAEVRRRLEDAVRVRLRADLPVACCLSGGLDSSGIAALAARSAGPLPCFTIAFDDPAYDERDAARTVAEHLGAELHLVPVSGRDLAVHLHDAVAAGEGLAINGQLVAKYLLARAIREAGFQVVLTGEGADELFDGYAHLEADRLEALGCAAAVDPDAATQAGIMIAAPGDPAPPALAAALGSVPAFLRAKAGIGARLRPLLEDGFGRRVAAGEAFPALLEAFDLPGQLAGRHPVDRARYLWMRLALAGYILRTLGDATEMASGVEGRVPFLDHHLFEYARTIVLATDRGPVLEKRLLRRALAPLLPAATAARRKRPLLAPPLPLDEPVQDLLRSRALDQLPFVDAPRVRRWLDQLPAQPARARREADPILWLLLSAAALQERFAMGAPP